MQRPAMTASVCAEFGLAWFLRSRLKIRNACLASNPDTADAATIKSPDRRAGI